MNLIFNRSDGFTFKKYSYLKNGSYAHASNKALIAMRNLCISWKFSVWEPVPFHRLVSGSL